MGKPVKWLGATTVPALLELLPPGRYRAVLSLTRIRRKRGGGGESVKYIGEIVGDFKRRRPPRPRVLLIGGGS
jgi:hypothetical protein